MEIALFITRDIIAMIINIDYFLWSLKWPLKGENPLKCPKYDQLLLDEHKTRTKKLKKLIRLHDRALGSITGPSGLQIGASLVAQLVKNPPVNAGDTRDSGSIPGLRRMATHSSILAWRIPWTEKPGRLQSMELPRVRHDWTTNTGLLGLTGRGF